MPSVTPGYCFTLGTNSFGALGLGEDVVEKPRAAHVDVAGKRLLGVACGGMHTVALAEDGSIYTWGVNDEGALGRPTSGSAWGQRPTAAKRTHMCQARLPDGVVCVQVVAGDGFTFVLTDQGCIYGWGQFKDDLSSFCSFSPDVQLQRLPALVYQAEDKRDRVRKLAAGARHMLALTRRGEVLSWGMAGQGQLGRMPPADVLLRPTAVKGIAAALGPNVTDIGVGSYASFAIGTHGVVAAWGLNNGGQLGLPLAAADDVDQCVWEPAAVPALGMRVRAVAGGDHHSLALTRDNKVLSFGSSNYGMLGRLDIPQPVLRRPSACLTLSQEGVSIAAGMGVSSCVTESGNAFTWGSNVNYQMAKGQVEADNVQPTRMRRHTAFGKRRVLQFCFGGQHAALL
ncbi:regulator of chromosome condensation 1/beta-lactamase-inhibitor protein II, partial [Scenedesmus sp. NREL 46B-D3]